MFLPLDGGAFIASRLAPTGNCGGRRYLYPRVPLWERACSRWRCHCRHL